MRKLSEKKKIAVGKAQRAEADFKKLEAHGKTLKTIQEKKAHEVKVKAAKTKLDEAKAAVKRYKAADPDMKVYLNFDGRLSPKSEAYVPDFAVLTDNEID